MHTLPLRTITLILIYFPYILLGCSLVENKNQLFISGAYSTYHTNHFWNKNGHKLSTYNNYHEESVHAYIEYGITDLDTVGIKSIYSRIEESVNGRTFGFGDFEANWRHLLYESEQDSFAFQAHLIIPSETTYVPNLRYGEWGGQFSLLYLRNFLVCDRAGWIESRVGYRVYHGFPSDQARADINLGYQLFSKFEVIASACLDYGVFNGKHHQNQSIILYNPNYRLLKAEIQGLYTINNHVSLSFGYFEHFWGNNVGAGGGLIGRANLIF
jgi:hypothetical protein